MMIFFVPQVLVVYGPEYMRRSAEMQPKIDRVSVMQIREKYH